MSKQVKVARFPNCDLCTDKARYDARTLHGSWAYMCHTDWLKWRMYAELGTGKGQELIVDVPDNTIGTE